MYPGFVPGPGTRHVGCLTRSQGLHPWAQECHKLGAAVQGLHFHSGRKNGASQGKPCRAEASQLVETCMNDMFQHREKLGSSLHCQCSAVLCLLNTAQYAPRH